MSPIFSLSEFWRDVVYAGRSSFHKRHRLVTLTIILIIALSTSTATIVFSVADALLIRALPFSESGELVSVEMTTAQADGSIFGRAPDVALYEAWRRNAADVMEIEGFQGGNATLAGHGPARTVQVVGTTWNAIGMLGARPQHGRLFATEDNARGALPIVVLSYQLWVQLFGGDTAGIGQDLTLNGRPFRVVGVMPPRFHIPLSIPEAQQHEPELWVPLRSFQELVSWPAEQPMPLATIGRARAGASRAAIEGRLDRIAKDVIKSRVVTGQTQTDVADVARVMGLNDARVRSVRTPLLLLAGTVALLVGLACLNVANLLMARTLGRERELATRVALGATRWRLVSQLVLEGIVVSLIGGLLGMGLAFAGVEALLDFGASYLPDVHTIAVNGKAMIFSLGIALATGVAVSAWPAVTKTRRPTAGALTARGTSTKRATRLWMRALVTVQIALAIVALTAMGLLGRSFLRLSQVQRGYDTANVIVAGVILPDDDYASPDARRTFSIRLLDDLRRDPTMRAPALSSGIPVVGGTAGMVRDADAPPSVKSTRMAVWSVEGDYFQSVGIPILRGGVPNFAVDRESVVIDAAAARLLFGSDDPLGRRIVWGAAKREGIVTTIAGDIQDVNMNVATNSRYRTTTPHVYVAAASAVSPVVRVSALATGDPNLALANLRETIARIDTDLPVAPLDTMEALVHRLTTGERFLFVIIALFGVVAIVLASVGIFALIAHSTAQRRHEFGVRLALGSQPTGIVSLVLREAMALSAIGTGVGILVALPIGQLLGRVLFETSPRDGLTIFGVVALTVMASLLASVLPAVRASRVSATVALSGHN